MVDDLRYEIERNGRVENKLNLYKKLQKLQDAMGDFAWEKDGINRHQQYKYITEAQYKANFRQALKEAGLLWSMELVEQEFVDQISDKQHLVLCKFKGTITDPDTGEQESYIFGGSGADGGDKALYKAVTGAHKFFLASNFNIAENNDPEIDADEVKLNAPSRPASPERREEIKEEVTKKDGQANAMQITALKKVLRQLKEADPEQENYIRKVIQVTKEFTDVTKEDAEKLIVAVGERVEKARKGE